ncbi:cation-translocating P-type ATPase [soil metagenome]
MENIFDITGLSDNEVLEARKNFGSNRFEGKKENVFLQALISLAKEPMIALLLAASSVYFISGETSDGLFMVSAILLVGVISFFQDSRSRNALEKLKELTQPNCKVIRNGKIIEIPIELLVLSDCMVVEEGTVIPADGIIIRSNDFSVNESILTGESLTVFKDISKEDNCIFQGTLVASGLSVAEVTAIGNSTKLGKIGKSLDNIKVEKTPLEIQIGNFVKKLVLAGAVVFLIVWGINYFRTYNILDSLLKALTLAMSILPEEIPVAFTTFMALGAWRLLKKGVIVKQIKTVETLGSATVICTDKTGTITENKMSFARLYTPDSGKVSEVESTLTDKETELITCAMWASEPIPFDPMEVALHKSYSDIISSDERGNYKMIHEYPLSGKPPMMTHIFENAKGDRIIAAKGAPEAILECCDISEKELMSTEDVIRTLSSEGFRILAVGTSHFEGNDFFKTQQEFKLEFKGIVAFYDPPKKNINKVFEDFYSAGIDVKIITGDNSATTASIAKQTGFKGYEKSITGEELMILNESELQKTVSEVNIFTRMFPEAKLKIINALKSNNSIVAMTGDGVNDGPALKAAHIGIAMGHKGTEIAKQAASLILIEDDLSAMLDAIAMGRRIYTNLKKAIRYIISIHIPIILTVFIPLALGWIYPNIFSPVHIIFFELIMGPTCSIIFENEPMEENTMNRKPRQFKTTFFNSKELAVSIVQGLMITAGTLIAYLYSVSLGFNENITRTMVFTVLLSSNIFLTLVNRSFFYSAIHTLKYKNNLIGLIIGVTILLSAVLLYFRPVTDFFQFESLNSNQLFFSITTGFIFVIWFEILKWFKRRNG